MRSCGRRSQASSSPRAALGISGEVAHADPVSAARGELDACDRRPQERIGDLQQDPGAVAGAGVRAFGAAVLEVFERVESLLYDCVARFAPQLRDERDTAGVVLVSRVVEAICPAWSGSVHMGVQEAGTRRRRRGPAKRTG